MGFTQFQTVLLDIPSSILQIVSLVGSGYLAGKFPNSRAIMMVCAVPHLRQRILLWLSAVYWQLGVHHSCRGVDVWSKRREMGVRNVFSVSELWLFSSCVRYRRLVAFWFTSFASVGFSLSLVMVSAVRPTAFLSSSALYGVWFNTSLRTWVVSPKDK